MISANLFSDVPGEVKKNDTGAILAGMNLTGVQGKGWKLPVSREPDCSKEMRNFLLE